MHYRLACNILGIEDGHDERTVKRAYAEKTKEFHPEEHPEEAEKIQQAYSFLIKDIRKNKLRVPTQEKRPVEEESSEENNRSDEEARPQQKNAAPQKPPRFEVPLVRETVIDMPDAELGTYQDYKNTLEYKIEYAKNSFRKSYEFYLHRGDYNIYHYVKNLFRDRPREVLESDEFTKFLNKYLRMGATDGSLHKLAVKYYDLTPSRIHSGAVPGTYVDMYNAVQEKKKKTSIPLLIMNAICFMAILMVVYAFTAYYLDYINPMMLLELGAIDLIGVIAFIVALIKELQWDTAHDLALLLMGMAGCLMAYFNYNHVSWSYPLVISIVVVLLCWGTVYLHYKIDRRERKNR